MKCSQCGTENLQDSKFCKECGMRLLEDDALTKPNGQLSMSEIDTEEMAQEVRTLLQTAVAALDAFDYETATRDATRAAELDRDSVLAHQLLVTLLERAGDYEGAYEHQSRIVELNPTAYSERQSLARIDHKRKNAWAIGAAASTKKLLSGLSPQVIAALAVGGVVLLVGSAILLHGKPSPSMPVTTPTSGARPSRVPLDNAYASAPAPTTPPRQAYVYQSPPLSTTPAPARTSPPASPGRPSSDAGVEPPAIPPLGTLVAKPIEEPRKPVVNPAPAPKPPAIPSMIKGRDENGNTFITNRPGVTAPAPTHVAPPPPPEPAPDKVAPTNASSVGGEGLKHQMQAFRLKDSGQTDQARAEFERAIASYEAQKKSGVKAQEADLGISTCRQALDLLR